MIASFFSSAQRGTHRAAPLYSSPRCESPLPGPMSDPGPPTPPPPSRQMRFLCSSMLVCGRDDLLAVQSYSNICLCLARALLFCRALRRFLLRSFRSSVLPAALVPPRLLSPTRLLPAPISSSSISSCAPNPLTVLAIATDSLILYRGVIERLPIAVKRAPGVPPGLIIRPRQTRQRWRHVR